MHHGDDASHIETVPFCSGYSPTNGQFVQYTTGSSPNPCYTAATSSGGGQGASVVTYTPGASVTLTCPSSTLDNVTVFDPGGTALSANMAVTFASCTTGQIVILRVIQAASIYTVHRNRDSDRQPVAFDLPKRGNDLHFSGILLLGDEFRQRRGERRGVISGNRSEWDLRAR